MTSVVEKLTVESFKQKVSNGDYENRTGALRALGRASMADTDKEKCKKAVLAHFGEASAAPKAAASKKTSKKASKKTGKRPSNPPAPPPGARVGKKKASKKVGKRSAPASRSAVRDTAAAVLSRGSESTVESHLERLGGVVKLGREGIAALEYARTQDAETNIRSGINAANASITTAMTGLNMLAQQIASSPGLIPVAAPAAPEAPVAEATAG